MEFRQELVNACLSVVGSYLATGNPDMGLELYGSFDEWSLIRSTLVWAGEEDPVKSVASVRDSDLSRRAFEAVLEAIHHAFGEKSFTTREVIDHTVGNQILGAAIDLIRPSEAPQTDAQWLGIWLLKHRDRRSGELVLTRRSDDRTKVATWAVIREKRA